MLYTTFSKKTYAQKTVAKGNYCIFLRLKPRARFLLEADDCGENDTKEIKNQSKQILSSACVS